MELESYQSWEFGQQVTPQSARAARKKYVRRKYVQRHKRLTERGKCVACAAVTALVIAVAVWVAQR